MSEKELVPNKKILYHTNDGAIKESRLGIDMYAKSGSMVVGTRGETGLIEKQYSVSMNNTQPFCAYLDVVTNPEAASVVTSNGLGEFTGNMKILPGNRIVNEVQFSPNAIVGYDYKGTKSYVSHRGIDKSSMVIANQNVIAIVGNKLGQFEPKGKFDSMLSGMALAENMQGVVSDAKQFTKMLPEYVHTQYNLDSAFRKDMDSYDKDTSMFPTADQSGQIEVNKAVYLSSLIAHQMSQNDRQNMIAYLNGLVVQQMMELQQMPSMKRQMSTMQYTRNTTNALYQQWSADMQYKRGFCTNEAKSQFESVREYSSNIRLSSENMSMTGIEQAHGKVLEQKNVDFMETISLPERPAISRRIGVNHFSEEPLKHPDRGSEFEDMLKPDNRSSLLNLQMGE